MPDIPAKLCGSLAPYVLLVACTMPCCHVHASMQIISQGHTVDLTGRTVPDVICTVEDCPYCQL